MSRALNTAYTQQNSSGAPAPFVAGKNKILNGDFAIWQRGTSFTLSSGVNTYTADRWTVVSTTGTTVQRQAFTLGSAPVPGYEGTYYLNQVINTASANYETVQRIEDVRTFAGQTVTLSFWARSTVGSQPLNAYIYQYFGTGGSPSSLVTTTLLSSSTGSYTYTPTSTWQRYWFTFSIPSISGKTLGTNNDSFLWVRIAQYTSGSIANTSLDLWGVQIEAGSVATPFSTATGNPASELAACMRYYQRFGQSSTDGAAGVLTPAGICTNTTRCDMTQALPVPMRIVPTSLEWSNVKLQEADNNQPVPSALSIDLAVSTNTYVSYWTTHTGGTATSSARMLKSTSAGYIGFSAEL